MEPSFLEAMGIFATIVVVILGLTGLAGGYFAFSLEDRIKELENKINGK